ncbi:hypothetical protein [Solibacillus cecembensis]|uniref:hypothetical protein n=1 Tax=Solibacillus cecembensis TaxID=459347 RepID=UPI003D052B7B
MIIFFTILTKKSGMGNYFRTLELYNQTKSKEYCEFYLYTEEEFSGFIDESVKVWDKSIYLNTVINSEQKNILVCDLPYIDYEFNDFLTNNFDLLITINDATIEEIQPNYYFNTDMLIKPPKNVISYLGLQYQIIRSDLIKNEIQMNKIQTIGVMFGGSDPDNLTLKFIVELSQSRKLKDFNFKIIVPLNKKVEFDNIVRKLKVTNIQIISSPDMVGFYLEINGVINMGGMSTYEAMYVGIPVFSVEWSYMDKYVKNLSVKNLIINLGKIEDSIKSLENSLNTLPIEKIRLMVSNASRVIDGLGSSRIVNKIIEISRGL